MMAASKRWTDEHQQQLKQARQAAGVSDVAFARDNSIALRHLKQLEEGGSTAFYSESIKFDMGVKLLKRLGVEAVIPAQEPDHLPYGQPTPAVPAVESVVDVPAGAAGSEVDASPIASRVPYVVLSLVGVAVLAAGISLIPSIHQPGATQGVVQTQASSSTATTQAPLPVETTSAVSELKPGEAMSSGLPPGSALPNPVATVTAQAFEPCDAAGAPQTIVPSQPSKSADYVYVTATNEVTLCVRDAAGQVTRKTLPGGQSFNIPGQQPFELTADKLDHLRVFFQGQRIWFDAGTTRLRLTAATASD